MSISSSAVLVELSISVWTATKLDRGMTDDLTADKAATRDAAQVHKNLMAGTSERKHIADLAQAARAWHASRTLPWSDKGVRLLPASLLLDYKEELDRRREQFQTKVIEFLDQYDVLVAKAAANLGAMFNPNDYPSNRDIASKFAFNFVVSPVPDSNDFRLDIPQQDLEDMRRKCERDYDDRLSTAMSSAWERLHTMLSGMSAKLGRPDEEGTVRRWHDTFVTNAVEMCGMLTHLNVTGDPSLERARKQLEQAMLGVDIEDIKEDPDTRAALKRKIDTVLNSYEW